MHISIVEVAGLGLKLRFGVASALFGPSTCQGAMPIEAFLASCLPTGFRSPVKGRRRRASSPDAAVGGPRRVGPGGSGPEGPRRGLPETRTERSRNFFLAGAKD